MKSLRFQKRLIAIVYHSIIFALTMAGAHYKIDWLVFIGIFDLLTFRIFPVVRFIQSNLITAAHCYSCQKQINLVDFWQCGCGYSCQIPQHIFKPCGQCGNIFSFINCPSCGIGILV